MRAALASVLLVAPALMANVVGNGNEIFNPALGKGDFVTVESGKLLMPGQFNLGFTYDYASNPLALEDFAADDGRYEGFGDDSTLQTGHITLAVGIFKWLELGVAAPIIFDAEFDNSSEDLRGIEGDLDGLAEIRAQLKFGLASGTAWNLALIGRANFPQLDNDITLGNGDDIGYGAELAFKTMLAQSLAMGANVGWATLNPDEPHAWTEDNITASVAFAYLLGKGRLVAEWYAAFPLDDDGNLSSYRDAEDASHEVLLAYKHNFGGFGAQVGVARELAHAFGTADLRVFAGLNVMFGGKAPKVVAPQPKPMPLPVETPVVETPVVQVIDAPKEVLTISDIKFASGSARISGDARTASSIAKAVAALKSKSFSSVEVAGHTDSMGAEAFNRSLSQKRADAVKNRVLSLGGFSSSQFKAVGYGESQPISSNATRSGRAENRRVEFKIFD